MADAIARLARDLSEAPPTPGDRTWLAALGPDTQTSPGQLRDALTQIIANAHAWIDAIDTSAKEVAP